MSLRLFGYGSLLFDPELEQAIEARIPARLEGHRRAFHSISYRRGCPAADSWEGLLGEPSPIGRNGFNPSLALGIVPAPGRSVQGVVLEYPAALRDRVLAATDPREGYDPSGPRRENHYLREERTVVAIADGRPIEAVVYVSNLDPDCPTHLARASDLDHAARILIAATPRERNGGRARGVDYLEGVRADLDRAGVVDVDLEALAAAVRAIPGPWTDLVRPPRAAPEDPRSRPEAATSSSSGRPSPER